VVTTPPGDLLDVETVVAWDNNVSLWVAESGAGPLSPVLLFVLTIFVIRRAIDQVKKRTISVATSATS
jgi:hypothetical protein